jgi:hypothetical protein
MTESDFKIGDRVAYIPYHAHGDIKHRDVEYGVITSKKYWAPNECIFVRFGNMQNSQGCKHDQLRLLTD